MNKIVKSFAVGLLVPSLVIPIGMWITGFDFSWESFCWYALGLLSFVLDIVIIMEINR